MLIDDRIWLIGDPHLGREFKNGVPLHRRGEREAMQLEQFKQELQQGEDMVVMVGDLFDKPFVPLPVINEAVAAVVEAAQARWNTKFIFLAGNHDKSRQLGTKGAWELFSVAVGWLPNVLIVDFPMMVIGVAFYPWEWGVPALDQVQNQPPTDCKRAIGHWDLTSFGGDDSHMCPAKLLQELGVEQIFSGHYHEEGLFQVDGIDVHCTGSMQPYTHAEDPHGELYVTLTVEEALARDDLHDKCVRILLQPGEVMPDIDCLQLTRKVEGAEETVEIEQVSLGNFDLHTVLEEEFAENEVPDEVQGYIKERLGAFA